MRQPTSGARAPVAINKYLLPREVQVATVRQHPAVLIAPSAQALGGLLVAGILSATYVHGVLGLIMWAAWLLLTTGFLTRRVNMMPLTKVTDMSFNRTFAGRLLGYGEFVVESAGQDQALRNVEYIPYPEQLYLLICGMLFPSSADDAEDGESRPQALADEL